MITKQQAMSLSHGAILHHVEFRNADGTPQRWRVSGKCQTWKRDLCRFRLPVMHGLYDHDAVTQRDAHLVSLP